MTGEMPIPVALCEAGFAEALLVREGGIVAVGSLEHARQALRTTTATATRTISLTLARDQGQQVHQAGERGGSDWYGGADVEVEVVEYDMGGSFLMPSSWPSPHASIMFVLMIIRYRCTVPYRNVVPGFVDAHVHLLPAGLSLSRVDLRGTPSPAALQRRLGEVAGRLGRGEWLLGGQWDEGEWGGEMPRTEWLDHVCGDHPAYLTRHDLHMALVNTAALQLAGIGPHTPDPEGGLIDRDPATGRPTGLLRERAMALVESLLPAPSPAERRTALAAASRLALSRGVTCVGDMGRYLVGEEGAPWRDLEEVYLPAADAGNLPVRVSAFMPLRSWRRLSSWVAVHGRAHPGGRLFWGGLKEFADGSLGSRTALMWKPYSDVGRGGSPGKQSFNGEQAEEEAAADGGLQTGPSPPAAPVYGQRVVGLGELGELTTAAVRAGLQVAVHAIGDRAVDEVALTYQEALEGELARGRGGPGEGGKGGGGLSTSSDSSRGAASDADGQSGSVGEGERLALEDTAAAAAAAGDPPDVESRRRLGQRLRLRIEHVQHLSGTSNTSSTLALSGLTAVPNPLHLLTDAPMLFPRLGRQRAAQAFALASLRRAGLRPALASDWPVVDLQPLTAVYAAVHRQGPPAEVARAMRRKLPYGSRFRLVGEGHTYDDEEDDDHDHQNHRREEEEVEEGADLRATSVVGDSVGSDERLTLEEALLGHTAWGAAALGLEDYVGRLAPGLRADLVELSDSLAERVEDGGQGGKGRWQLSEERLRRCMPVVTRTWVDGQLVYDRGTIGQSSQLERE
ncbi:hypothetical protein VOLCADRAFT_94988 [Volvox carteri f. nagariensis]|uniref:Amidohydrolase 3 domain-containing protein n=1 Tax=Volvox carteri f. nagariensis TaxID=3068 RepID=D8U6B0_VOLCA|nr:uncharacterized protein VOLCADRAFT_94988 [Volvox carteri f. nagariensis]EFJ44615.1 hypothetical protein VOLCADRAFT_94988 [Volvox carteri f. nagariensis]|eukprot:XP_002954191.1 hypothetical protein VOLCADRAFT_94988 [Volvox carteri f. nagariensis]